MQSHDFGQWLCGARGGCVGGVLSEPRSGYHPVTARGANGIYVFGKIQHLRGFLSAGFTAWDAESRIVPAGLQARSMPSAEAGVWDCVGLGCVSNAPRRLRPVAQSACVGGRVCGPHTSAACKTHANLRLQESCQVGKCVGCRRKVCTRPPEGGGGGRAGD